MKKFLSILIVYFVYSVSVFAQNYTIQSVHSYNQNYVPKNYTTGEQVINSAFDAFCQGSRNFLLQSSSQSVNSIQHFVFDPYLIEIDGIRYMLVKDNNDGKFDFNDILGIEDTPSNIFASLRTLDANHDNKLTGQELQNANIRLVKINSNGKLAFDNKSQDFETSDIVFIHLSEIRKAYNNNGNVGDFGYYDAVIKDKSGNKKLVTGVVTFESKVNIQKYFI